MLLITQQGIRPPWKKTRPKPKYHEKQAWLWEQSERRSGDVMRTRSQTNCTCNMQLFVSYNTPKLDKRALLTHVSSAISADLLMSLKYSVFTYPRKGGYVFYIVQVLSWLDLKLH